MPSWNAVFILSLNDNGYVSIRFPTPTAGFLRASNFYAVFHLIEKNIWEDQN